MKKWNVRYIFRSIRTGEITRKIFDLSTIELGTIPQFLAAEGLKILFRDMGSGVLDIDGQEIFENDLVKSESRNQGMPIKITFKEGQFLGEYGNISKTYFSLDQEFEQRLQIIGDEHPVETWMIEVTTKSAKDETLMIGKDK